MATLKDPGLQPERTSLAWRRTSAVLLLNGFVTMRSAYMNASIFLAILTGILLIATIITFVYGVFRAKGLALNLFPIPLPIASIRSVTLIGLAAAMSNILFIIVNRFSVI
ncbi:hypothetical protein W822_12425 [Advenella kashmirensis W13003]|uniref:DUF202 domain-containing protein n=1 Tax=Advenella kashmirensis W13003 TaxID=1424334 RepID=V8QPQ6_9BURK|nr:DUF202 domain-containing protein [Advenella kashmirensis]ETF01607.1 hypothetical protein W822_12425 [Advenella kashmirensis W13003]